MADGKRTFMKRLTKVVRSGHGGRMGSISAKEEPVITDRLKAEDFVFTKVCTGITDHDSLIISSRARTQSSTNLTHLFV